MSSEKRKRTTGAALLLGLAGVLWLPSILPGHELFIYRRYDPQENLLSEKRITMHGELFGELLYPSSYPSYNDLSGEADRWNFGFHDRFFITPTTAFHAQLVTHDKDGERTKFDWHFSVRQRLAGPLALDIGHDSDHDSDHTSTLNGKSYYTNRNYIGVHLGWSRESFLIEPFLRFFHNTNQRVHLDLSGEKAAQEYGLRVGASFGAVGSLSLQVLGRSGAVFGRIDSGLGELVLRFRLEDWLELTVGGGIWADAQRSPRGQKQTFSKLVWGIAILF
ncbi:MAG: hypothetical protein JXE07_05060 [Candidatus Aminicenantes bacterium]|nr:hypothetical protein [Candidatus Aminicenantes bacterium]